MGKFINKRFIIFIATVIILQIIPLGWFFLNVAEAEELTENQTKVEQLTEVPEEYIGIYTADDLNKIRNKLTDKYILMNDINLSNSTAKGGAYYNNGSGWEPIGTEKTPFSGVFDGNGYKIIGMNINITSEETIYAGLFGYAKKAEIKNLGMVDSIINVENTSIYSTSSKAYAGGIVGFIYDSTNITNSYNTGNITAVSMFDSFAGGLAGAARKSSIMHSYNTGDVTANSRAGGIVGFVEYDPSIISHSYNTGNINADRYAGGITAFFSGKEITDSYNTGKIHADTRSAAGIAASITATAIRDCYNEGTVGGYNSGGIVGDMSSSTIENCDNSGFIFNTTNSSLSKAAGVAADVSRSVILNSSNSGEIEGYYAGGVAGVISSSTMMQSFNEGSIIGTGSTAGGIVSNIYTNSVVENSYNIGKVSAKYNAGGIAGKNDAAIKSSYNIGTVKTSSLPYSGAIAGQNEGTILHSYFVEDKGVGKGTEEGTAKTTLEDMKKQSTFEGFDFDKVWTIDGDDNYRLPQLNNMSNPSVEKNVMITLKSKPDKLVYAEGEELDLTGAIITVRTNFGNLTDANVTSPMISGYHPNQTGQQVITITLGDLSTSFPVTVLPTYTVVIQDCDGNVLKTETVVEDSAATAPGKPEKIGYTFLGWSDPFNKVTSDLTITAMCDINTYTVTFMDEDGTVLNTQTVNYNSSAVAPKSPVRQGYTFIGWDKDFSQITSNVTVTAKYKINQYTVTFQDEDSTVLDKQTVNHGSPVSPPQNPAKTGHTFIGWDKDLSKVTSDLTIKAMYDPNKYTVTFRSFDGNRVEIQTVNYGSSATPPEQSKRTGYTFIGWDKDLSKVTSDVTITEKFRINTYKVSFKNGDRLINTQTVNYDSLVKAPKNPTKTGYTFLGWYKDSKYRTKFSFNTAIKSNTTLYAQFVKNPALPKYSKATSAGFNKVKVSWGKVTGANGYEIYRATSISGKYSRVKTITSGSTVSYTNSSLTTGKTYYYKIRAYRTIDGKKIYSSFSSIISGKPILAKPASIKASNASSTSVKVSWSKVSEASGYEIYRSTSKSGSYKKVTTVTKGSIVSYTNKSLTTGKTYYYKIRAYRIINGKKIFSSFSSIISGKPVLAKPASIKASKASSTSVKVSWSKVSKASGYELYRSTSKSGSYKKVLTVTKGSIVSYTNKSLTKRKRYYYKVRSYRIVSGKKVYSSYSSAVYCKL